jgi:hypothetical protein
MELLEKWTKALREQRHEELERALYARWDELRLEGLLSGSVIRFEAPVATETPIWGSGEKTVTYAALAVEAPGARLRWFMTGHRSLDGAPTEDLIAWLIEHDVDPDSVEVAVWPVVVW